MRLSLRRFSALLLLACAAAVPAAAKSAPRSFSLSTTRTFSPGEAVKIQLIAHNEPSLEFRVYKVRDALKFFSGLKDIHSFGVQSYAPKEQIDQRTFIERMHDFKAHLWWLIRHFFRAQFTDDARDTFREKQASLGKRTHVVGLTQFSQIPLLNSSQLVARWVLVTPPQLVSPTQQLPINGLAAGVYLIEATDGTYKAYTVAIVTRIAVVERTQNNQANLYVGDRVSGAPVPNAAVAMWANGRLQSSGKADANGMASLAMTGSDAAPGAHPDNVWLLAQNGADTAVMTPWSYGFGQQRSQYSAYVYTDRPVYRPGHTVHIKAFVRKEVNDTLVLPDQHTLTLRVTGPDDKILFNKEVPVSAHGSISADLDLQSDAALGYYYIDLGQTVGGGGNFYVEDYKKPEYQVTITPATKRVLQGNSLQATINARYFFGEPVAGAKVTWEVYTSQHYWEDQDEEDQNGNSDYTPVESDDTGDTYGLSQQQEHQGVLDANGQLSVTLPTQPDPKHNDQDYRIEARVTDPANREVAGHATVLATYGSFRISVQPASYVVQNGQPARVKITAQDYDGHPIKTPVHIAASLVTWDSTTYKQIKTPKASADATTGDDGTALVDVPISGTGDFQFTASAQTPENRTVQDETWVWIWNGAGSWYQPNAQAQIVADKKSYSVGDTAHLLLVTGLSESWAVVTTEGDSVQSRRLIHSTGQSTAFDVPITQQSQPNLIVTAVILHDNQLMKAQRSLKVPAVERALTLTATPAKSQYEPGDAATFDVSAVDSQGNPVQASFSFGVVDEALYKVRPDTTGDIVAAFYPQRYVMLDPQTSFDFYFYGEAGRRSPLLARLNDGLYHPRMAQVKPGSDLVVPKIRKAFPDTAYWNPDVRTGPDGHARVTFTFPDALTTWRTTVRAMTDDGKAGGVVTRVLVRKNLIVRLAAPRFFRQGDETVLRVIAHNYLATAKDVTFALDVAGVDVLSGKSQSVNIPASGESYVDWRVKARTTGNAVLTAKALTNEESDALQITLPILPYGVKQRAAAAGEIFSGPGQNQWSYTFPSASDSGSRAVTITVSPSVAGTIFDALDYLTSYPWGCTEQTMSSFLPDLIVAQAIDKLHLKSPIDPKTLKDMVNAGVQRLANYQHDDGGWGWWPDDPSRVFMTAYVVSGLGQARAAGYAIDDGRFNRGRAWLQSALAAHPDMLPDLRAYTVYALATTGGAPKDALDKIWSSRDNLSDEGLALAGLALDAAGDARAHDAALLLEKKARTTDVDAYWQGSYDSMLDDWDNTSPETTAFALKLLIRQDRSSGLLPKAARWLGANRTGEYWYSTKQTAMVVQGLTDYLTLSGELANSSDVEILLNGASIARHHFGAADALAQPWKITIPAAQAGAAGQLAIRKSGNGITYWSAQSLWYSADRELFQQGKLALNITRNYYLLRKRQDKPTDPITYDLVPLNGPVHIGDIIAVRLALGGTSWKYLIAEDPIPAGTEFLPETGLYKLNNKPDWWADFFTRKEFHDDRAAFFNTDFNGRREYVYLLKVDNPGKFVVSPAQAGPMYQSNVLTTTDPATLEVQP
jgi:uncharacterized protein YfaS (alpha-2-macroglobulin family)